MGWNPAKQCRQKSTDTPNTTAGSLALCYNIPSQREDLAVLNYSGYGDDGGDDEFDECDADGDDEQEEVSPLAMSWRCR